MNNSFFRRVAWINLWLLLACEASFGFDLSPDGRLLMAARPSTNGETAIVTYNVAEDRVARTLGIRWGYRARTYWAGPRRVLLVVERKDPSGVFQLRGIYRFDVNDNGVPLLGVIDPAEQVRGVRISPGGSYLKAIYVPAGSVTLKQLLPLPSEPDRALLHIRRGDQSSVIEMVLTARYRKTLYTSDSITSLVSGPTGKPIFVQDAGGISSVSDDGAVVSNVVVGPQLEVVGFDARLDRLLALRSEGRRELLRVHPETGESSDSLFVSDSSNIGVLFDDLSGEAIAFRSARATVFLDQRLRQAQTVMDRSIPGAVNEIIDVDQMRTEFVFRSRREGREFTYLLSLDPPRLRMLAQPNEGGP